MELFDYVRYRWKPLLVLFVVGLVAILVLGHNSRGDVYHARTQLILRPPVDAQTRVAADADDYVTTQLQLMLTPDYLEAEANGTSVSPDELQQRLSYTQAAGSQFVVLQIDDRDPQQAISLVNAVATNYLDYAQDKADQPAQQEMSLLQNQIRASRAALKQANATIQADLASFVAANPDLRNPSASAVSPKAAATQELQTQRLQQLLQQQAELQIEQAQVVAQSEVLRPAQGASLTPGWGPSTYLALVAGLVLALLTLAGIGLALTSRLVSPSRWVLATEGGHLAKAIRLRGLTSRSRLLSARRVATALAAVRGSEAATLVTYVPGPSKSLRRRTAFLLKTLEDQGIPTEEIDSVSDVGGDTVGGSRHADPDAATPPNPRVLLLVEMSRARLDDVAVLTSYPDTAQNSWVPVLV